MQCSRGIVRMIPSSYSEDSGGSKETTSEIISHPESVS